MRNIFFTMAVLVSTNVSAASSSSLPDWAIPSTKLTAVDQFVEWMKKDKFNKINGITSRSIVIPSGQDSAEVIIKFDDVTGCKDRLVQATCTPLDPSVDHAMYCDIVMTDCEKTSFLHTDKITTKN